MDLPLRTRTRNQLFPAKGPAYELFDSAVYLLILAVVGYVVTEPPSTTDKALSAPFNFYDQQVWGTALAVVAVVGIVCSYRNEWLDFGYRVLITACLFWGSCFAYGMISYGASGRVIISVTLYGWIASRLWRESKREPAVLITDEDKR